MDSQQLRQTGEDYLIRSSLLSDVVAASGGPVFVRAEGIFGLGSMSAFG